MEVRECGRMAVPAKRKRVPRYFTGLPADVPERVHFPGVGELNHFNIAHRTDEQDIRAAVVQSLNSLPESVSTVVLLGATRNPRDNSEIAVFVQT